MTIQVDPANVATGALDAGVLSADATGRALMATGFFTEAKATDAFAAGALATTVIKGSAVTGAKLATTFIKVLSFTGVAAAGPITLTGAAVGDRVVGVVETTATDTGAAAKFESTITVVNQIQQSSASDLSLKKYFAILIVASA